MTEGRQLVEQMNAGEQDVLVLRLLVCRGADVIERLEAERDALKDRVHSLQMDGVISTTRIAELEAERDALTVGLVIPMQ